MNNLPINSLPMVDVPVAQPIFEHIHKNLWLVGNYEGVQAAAKVVTHQNGKNSLPVHVINNRMQLTGKFPCIIVLVQVDCAMAEVMSVITDTTLNHCIRAIGALPQ